MNMPISQDRTPSASLGAARAPEVWTNPLAEAFEADSGQASIGIGQRYGYAFLTSEQIEAVRLHTCDCNFEIVSVATGKGYPARQLKEAGCNVIAYSTRAAENASIEVLPGDYTKAAEHPERALLISIAGEDLEDIPAAIKEYAKAGGKLVILNMVCHDPSIHNCGRLDKAMRDTLFQCKRLADIAGPVWEFKDGWFSRDPNLLTKLPYRMQIFDCSALGAAVAE